MNGPGVCRVCSGRPFGCAYCRPPGAAVTVGTVVPATGTGPRDSLPAAPERAKTDAQRLVAAKALALRIRRRIQQGDTVGMDEVEILVNALLG